MPAERPPQQAEAELINAEELPAYQSLPELTPDQATELLKSGRIINALNDVDEILKALPNEMSGKKEALRGLIGAAADLITAYRSEHSYNSPTSKSFALGGLNKLRDSLRGFGFEADEQQEMINRANDTN